MCRRKKVCYYAVDVYQSGKRLRRTFDHMKDAVKYFNSVKNNYENILTILVSYINDEATIMEEHHNG